MIFLLFLIVSCNPQSWFYFVHQPPLQQQSSLLNVFPYPGEPTRLFHGVDEDKVCLTESCIKETAKLINQMDRTEDPCNDFYRYVCGGYLEKTIIPQEKSEVGVFQPLEDALNFKLKKVFESENSGSEPKIYKGIQF